MQTRKIRIFLKQCISMNNNTIINNKYPTCHRVWAQMNKVLTTGKKKMICRHKNEWYGPKKKTINSIFIDSQEPFQNKLEICNVIQKYRKSSNIMSGH